MKLNKIPETGTSEPYYDFLCGGYYTGESFSDDPETIKKINEAINVINRCVDVLEENELLY